MPGVTDLLVPLAALGVGAYTVKKIVTAPQITPIAPQDIAQITSGSVPIVQIGAGGNAPISSSLMQFPNPNLQTWASAPQMPEYMQTSDAGKAFTKSAEGFRNVAYKDVVGNWTIGWGHKIQSNEQYLLNGVIDTATLQSLFDSDINTAESIVKQLVNVPVTQGQFDALVDFVFNLGRSRLASSTLLRLLNAGNYQGAANEFGKWVYAGNRVVASLQSRRAGETQMFVA